MRSLEEPVQTPQRQNFARARKNNREKIGRIDSFQPKREGMGMGNHAVYVYPTPNRFKNQAYVIEISQSPIARGQSPALTRPPRTGMHQTHKREPI